MIEIKIVMEEETGQVNVTAPFAQKLVCYGLLEIARQIITNYKMESPLEMSAEGKPELKIVDAETH